jgi:hypothetical protein
VRENSKGSGSGYDFGLKEAKEQGRCFPRYEVGAGAVVAFVPVLGAGAVVAFVPVRRGRLDEEDGADVRALGVSGRREVRMAAVVAHWIGLAQELSWLRPGKKWEEGEGKMGRWRHSASSPKTEQGREKREIPFLFIFQSFQFIFKLNFEIIFRSCQNSHHKIRVQQHECINKLLIL